MGVDTVRFYFAMPRTPDLTDDERTVLFNAPLHAEQNRDPGICQ